MQKKVQIFLEKNHMIEKGDHVIVGFSGGADSVCLLLVLKNLREQMHFEITAVHVEHGIRGEESRSDAAFAKNFCKHNRIDFLLYEVDARKKAKESHQTLEEAARELRYDCFSQACGKTGANKIAVAHHGDDCAETVLFHLSRGTGIKGLCGIAPVRGNIIRPLLCVTRGDIEQYLEESGQEYCTDSTNQDTAYARNRIRHNILPELSYINPQTVQHIVRTAGYLEEVCDYLEQAAWEAGKAGIICSYEAEQLREISILKTHFAAMHPVLQKNLLHQILGKAAGSSKDITAQHIGAVLRLFDAQVGKTMCLPCQLRARTEYESVVIGRSCEKEMKKACEEGDAQELILGQTVWRDTFRIHADIFQFDGNYEKIPSKTYTKWFDYDKIENTVLLRTRRPGDFIQVDAAGGHKKLKDFFIDVKIPRKQREEILLLADGNHILWVVGWRISEAYKVTQKTKRILSVCVDGGNNDE